VATLGLAVVVTFFTKGGRPVMAGWRISIWHPVSAASRGDIVIGEKPSRLARDGGRLHCYFDEGITCATTVESLLLPRGKL
jgi:hypothetical protein